MGPAVSLPRAKIDPDPNPTSLTGTADELFEDIDPVVATLRHHPVPGVASARPLRHHPRRRAGEIGHHAQAPSRLREP
jgi:hypothetical protein